MFRLVLVGFTLHGFWNIRNDIIMFRKDNSVNFESLLSVSSSSATTSAKLFHKELIQIDYSGNASSSSPTNSTTIIESATTSTRSNNNNVSNITSTLKAAANSSSSSRIQVAFFIGLEGTGHHLMGEILQNSPVLGRHKRIGLTRNDWNDLSHNLYKDKDDNGLWNAFCNTSPQGIDTVELKQTIVSKIQQMVKKVLIATNNQPWEEEQEQVIYYPLNTLTELNGYGEVSYPNFHGRCRFLQYPNIDLWDDVCEEAGVDCSYVLVYRDPIQILHSTVTKRRYNPTMFVGIYLYNTMLSIIESQLVSSSSSMKTSNIIGCYGFYEPGNMMNSTWYTSIRRIWGWKNNPIEYSEYMNNLYKPPSSSSKEQQQISYDHDSDEFIQSRMDYLLNITLSYTNPKFPKAPKKIKSKSDLDHYQPYVKLLYQLHHRHIQICNDRLSDV